MLKKWDILALFSFPACFLNLKRFNWIYIDVNEVADYDKVKMLLDDNIPIKMSVRSKYKLVYLNKFKCNKLKNNNYS